MLFMILTLILIRIVFIGVVILVLFGIFILIGIVVIVNVFVVVHCFHSFLMNLLCTKGVKKLKTNYVIFIYML